MPITIKKNRQRKYPNHIIEDLKQKAVADKERDFRETGPRREQMKVYLDQLAGLLPQQKEHRSWESTISLPITWTESDIVATRMDQALTETPQIAVMKPTNREDVDRTAKKEQWFNWLCVNYIKEFFETLDRSINTTVRLGMSVLYSYYEKEVRPIINKKSFKVEPESFFDDYSFITKCEELIMEIYGDSLIEEPKEIGEYKWEVKYWRKTSVDSIVDKVKDTAILNFWPVEDESRIEIDIDENHVVYDGVRFKTLPIDNVWFPASVCSNEELQSCDHVGISFEMSYSQIARNQADGVYDLLTDDDLKEIKGFQKGNEEIATDKVKTTVNEQAGVKPSTESDKSKGVRCWELYYKYDIVEDGYSKDIIFTYLPDVNKVVRIRRLNEVFAHGERPIDIAGYALREGSIFSIGVAEILHYAQEEVDVLHNQFINYNTVATVPFGFVKTDSSFGTNLERKEIEIKPATLFSTPDPKNDVYFPPRTTNLSWTMQDVGFLISQMQDSVGSSDAMRGRQQFSRTPVGTTRELLSEANVRVKQALIRYNRVFKNHLRKIYQLQRAYGPDKQTFRIMGEQGDFIFDEITREDLKTLPDFELGTSIDNLNKAYMKQNMLLLTQMMVSPLNLQMGIVQPHNAYEHYRKVYDVFDIKDYHKLITKPMANLPLDPEEENILMMQGQKVDVNQLDDDNYHLQKHTEFRDSPKFGLVEPEHLPIFSAHEIQTRQAIQRKIMADMAMKQEALKQQQSITPQAQPGVQQPKLNPMMPAGGGQMI
jgi:hypothetical protein